MKWNLLLLCAVFFFVQVVNGQDWKNIVPLKSTKIEVEKTFGLPVGIAEFGENGFKYTVPKGEITVFYGREKCRGEISGWNVEPDTVLTLTFYPSEKGYIDYKKFNTDGLIHFSSHTLTSYFADPEKGLVYIFGTFRDFGSLIVTPKVSDNYRRCEGFAPYNAAGAFYIPSEGFSETDIKTGRQELFSLIVGMGEDAKIYFVAYSGSNLSGKKYDNYLQQIRKFIRSLSKKGLDQSRVIVIDGGRKKLFEVLLFYIAKEYPPPMPQPDL